MVTPISARVHNVFSSGFFSWLFLCSTVHLLAPSLARADSEGRAPSPESFLSEYRKNLSGLDASFSDVIVEGVAGTKTLTNFVYVTSGENVKLGLRRELPEWFDRTFVSRANHKFVVRRLKAEGAYFVENLFDSDEQWQNVKGYDSLVRKAAFTLGGVPDYLKRVNSPDFAVKNVSRVLEANVATLNVEFEYANQADLTAPKLKGWFRVEPGLGWVTRSYSYERRYAILSGKKAGQESVSRVEGWVTYRSEGGKPIPMEIQMKVSRPDGRPAREDHFAISSFLCVQRPIE